MLICIEKWLHIAPQKKKFNGIKSPESSVQSTSPILEVMRTTIISLAVWQVAADHPDRVWQHLEKLMLSINGDFGFSFIFEENCNPFWIQRNLYNLLKKYGPMIPLDEGADLEFLQTALFLKCVNSHWARSGLYWIFCELFKSS